ncbi:MAG: phosphoribosylformylglycinamidine synthase subunit PurQ, partial [Clostridia bacterium]|nr:phosphoribosylformylglycinamidine synthase subunit PurQ [Clostridia bacterium]
VVLDKGDADKFIAAADEENLEAYTVAVVTESPRLVMNWNGDTIVDLSREFLNTNGVTQTADVLIKAPADEDYRHKVPENLAGLECCEALVSNLARLEVCSQKGLCERFDASIGAATVLMPFAGKYQLTPEEAMVAKVPVLEGQTDTATAMSYGYIPGHSRQSPFHSAAYAVVESLSKLAAVGADTSKARLTFQEYFERLYDKSERWGKPAAALLGALTAQLEMGVPSIGGKDSMSGSFNDMDVPPTLVSFALSMTGAKKTVSACASDAGDKLVLLPVPENTDTQLPDWDKLKALYSELLKLSESGKIKAASVVKEGGSAAAVCRMCFGNKLGFDFDISDSELLFAPLSGSIVSEVKDTSVIPESLGAITLGTVTNNNWFTAEGTRVDIDRLIDAWEGKLESVFPSYTDMEPEVKDTSLYTEKSRLAPAIKTASPRVLIPVFPGTNCEVDTARAFEKAGAQANIVVVRNLTSSAIEETIAKLTDEINNSQIIMLPGGFSGGDEPDGSGKFIATTFRNPKIAEAVTRLLEQRDGLMLGICNGFQALIKLGLVPYGKITDICENDPTLTFNTLGRHVSRMVYTRVTSVKSPWFTACDAGDVFAVPVSHGEGRFIADNETLERLVANGQIATQYVDPAGNPSSAVVWNPNGSYWAIEGITSPDGRILGKMGHSERKGDNLYKNVPGEKDQKIFESGVKYFK